MSNVFVENKNGCSAQSRGADRWETDSISAINLVRHATSGSATVAVQFTFIQAGENGTSHTELMRISYTQGVTPCAVGRAAHVQHFAEYHMVMDPTIGLRGTG